ncbi:MAG: DNA primase noncatalytic subunit PriX [Candidatus Aenigmatarchaeota archaeon]
MEDNKLKFLEFLKSCSFCNSKKGISFLPTPVDVIVDSDGNILYVIESYNLPVCSSCRQTLFSQRNYKWIEKILETPFRDGRKRIVDLILMPYLANVKKLGEKESIEVILKWFKICGYSEEEYKKSGKRLNYQYQYVKRRNYAPLRYSNFLKTLSKFAVKEWKKQFLLKT